MRQPARIAGLPSQTFFVGGGACGKGKYSLVTHVTAYHNDLARGAPGRMEEDNAIRKAAITYGKNFVIAIGSTDAPAHAHT